nr:uncharacterized protein LOC133581281 isoform X2 [Nerophis lumbriciformis]
MNQVHLHPLQCSLTHLHPLCPLSPPCLKPQLIYLQLPPQRPLHTMDHHQLRQLTQLSGLLSSQIQTGLSRSCIQNSPPGQIVNKGARKRETNRVGP